MRWGDAYIGLAAAVFGFGGLVVWLEGRDWATTTPLLALAVAALAWMAFRAVRTAKVVLVGDARSGPVIALQTQLDEAGFGIKACPGPSEKVPCPAADGEPCPLGDHPVAAVIFRAAGTTVPAPPCGRALGVPALRVEEQASATSIASETDGQIGWTLGPAAAVDALKDLMERRGYPETPSDT